MTDNPFPAEPWRHWDDLEATANAWASMGPIERLLRIAICDVWRLDPADVSAGELQRRIVVTPYYGAYGVAGHTVAIEGMPPRFLATILGTGPMSEVIVLSHPGIRRITATKPARWQTLRRALLDWIREGSDEAAVNREFHRIAAAAWDRDPYDDDQAGEGNQ